MSIPTERHIFPFLVLTFLLVALQPATAEVYIKLFPGKELCLTYEGYRNPEEDPPTVDFRHRAMMPRNVNVRTHLFDPNGKSIPLSDHVDPYGTPSSLFFKVEQTGTYYLCLRTPLSHPPLEFEMRFVGENDLVDPATTVDGAAAVDKPVEEEDYEARMHMLDLCVQVTLDEIRMTENRLYLFDRTTRSTYHRVIAALAINIALAIGLNVWGEKYLERFFMKKKIV